MCGNLNWKIEDLVYSNINISAKSSDIHQINNK